MMYAHEGPQEAMLWRAALRGMDVVKDGTSVFRKEFLAGLAPRAWRDEVQESQCWNWTLTGYLKGVLTRQRLISSGANVRSVNTALWLLVAAERVKDIGLDLSKQLLVGTMSDRDGEGPKLVGVPFVSMPVSGRRAAPGTHIVVQRGGGGIEIGSEFSWSYSACRASLSSIEFVGIRVDEVDYYEDAGNDKLCERLQTQWVRHAAWLGFKEGGLPCWGQGRSPSSGFVGQVCSCPLSRGRGVRIFDMGGLWLLDGGGAVTYR